MSTLNQILPAGLTEALGTALFHSLWQAAAAGLALLLCILFIPRRYAQVRYLAGVISIIAMVVLPAATFIFSYPDAAGSQGSTVVLYSPEISPSAAAPTLAPADISPQEQVMQWFRQNQSLLVMLWVVGITFYALRFSGGYLLTRGLRRRGLGEVPAQWHQRLAQMSQQMRVGQPVQLHTSSRITVPMVIGFFKPMILFPVGMLADLTPDQVELILAHELAHVRRYDYAVNLLLSLAQILLFFHPAMWLASRFVRQERENCCDAIALRYHPDPARYARTLLTLETYRQRGLALSASGGSLTERIARILNLRGKPNPVHFATAGILALALVVSVMASTYQHTPFMREILGFKDPARNVTLDDVVITASDTDELTPVDQYSWVVSDSEEVVVTILRDGKKTEIKMVEGQVVSVIEEGRMIEAREFPIYQEMALQTMANTQAPVPPLPPLEPVPPVPPVPVWNERETSESFNRKMDAWEAEMEAWQERMDEWSARNEEAFSDHPPLPECHEMEAFGRHMEEMGEDLARTLGDEEQWEEFGRAMERMAESMAEQFDGEKGGPGDWSRRDREAFERDMERLGKDLEKWGEDFGKRMEEMAKMSGEEMEELSREMEKLAAEDAERAAELEHEDALAASGYHYTAESIEVIAERLVEDGLISSRNQFTFKLNGKGMWVNGKKMDDHIYQQYLPLLEELFGNAKGASIAKSGGSTTLNLD